MVDLVNQNKVKQVNERLYELGVTEENLREEFIKGSGCGGQKINKTNSCVQLTYLKTGWVIRCQQTRSREQNRFLARRILLERLEADVLGKKSAKAQKAHKIRAQKKKRSKRAKEKVLKAKHARSELKALRQVKKTYSDE